MRYFQADTYDELRTKLENDFYEVEMRITNNRDLSVNAVEKISRATYYGTGYINQLPHKEIWRVGLEEV